MYRTSKAAPETRLRGHSERSEESRPEAKQILRFARYDMKCARDDIGFVRHQVAPHSERRVCHSERQRRIAPGFTLVELIVAATIFSIIAAIVAGVFVASMRATQAGYQAIDANEMARGAVALLERDLGTAFTARDSGDYYQFFGTPIGMMFIGLVKTADETTELARVTYVLHNNEGTGQFDTTIYRETTGDWVPQTVRTYSLIRLVEVGVEDLDTFPGVDWRAGDPPMVNEINAYLDDTTLLPRERLALANAKKRELWLRMLSGAEADLPNGWDYVRVLPNEGTAYGEDPLDFAIAENIESERPPAIAYDLTTTDATLVDRYFFPLDDTGNGYFETEPNRIDEAFFAYGRVGYYDDTATLWEPIDVELSAYWNSVVNFERPTAAEEAVGNPVTPRLPEVVQVRLPFKLESPYLGGSDTTRKIAMTIQVPSGYTRADMVEAVP